MPSVNKAPKSIESIRGIIDKICTGEMDVNEIIYDVRSLISQSDETIKAWQSLDWDEVQSQYENLILRKNWRSLPLAGVPIAVKDIYDTADFVTTYGSDIYRDHRPVADADIVTMLRAMGAVVIGKTVTTEFAYWQAGATVNPHDYNRTPGGSSSGSAAAVASGMVPLALGTQTAASTIRPAAYCGIIGFKPSFGLLPLKGVKPLAPSLDTVGLFTRSIGDLIMVFNALKPSKTNDPDSGELVPKHYTELVLSKLNGRWNINIAPSCLEAVEHCYKVAESRGCKLSSTPTEFLDFDRLTDDQVALMAAEASSFLKSEVKTSHDKLSVHIRKLISDGEGVSEDRKIMFQETKQKTHEFEKRLFHQSDILICPSTLDTAPSLTEGTGNPLMSRAFTLLGLPSLSLPYGFADNGMPVGVQVVARHGADLHLLLFAKKYLTERFV